MKPEGSRFNKAPVTLIQRHPLRGFDAIHLASALILKENLGEQVTFVGADERQLQAAAREDLIVLDVEK